MPSTGPVQSRSPMLPPQSPPYWQRAFSRAQPRPRRWLSLLSSYGKRRIRASSPGAGEGSCLRFVVIDTSHSDLTVSAVPRHDLTFLSVVFRGMGIRSLTLIGRGHFSEVYSCKDLNGHPTGRVVKVSASSLDSIKGGQTGTEAYAMYLGEMCALSGKRSPFVLLMLELILLAAPAKHNNQYVLLLFMEEDVQTAKDYVLHLAAGIHLLDGSFSQPGLMEAAKFVKAALEPLSILHSLGIAHRDLKPAIMLIGKDNTVTLDRSEPSTSPYHSRDAACHGRRRVLSRAAHAGAASCASRSQRAVHVPVQLVRRDRPRLPRPDIHRVAAVAQVCAIIRRIAIAAS